MAEYINELGVAAIVVILLLREILPHFTKRNGNQTSKYIEYKTLASIEEAMRQTNHALASQNRVTTQLVERVSELRIEVREAVKDCRRKER